MSGHKKLIITWSSPDRVGLLASITSVIAQAKANLLEVVQHTDPLENWFFLRIEADISTLGKNHIEALKSKLKEMASHETSIYLAHEDTKPRVALLVSKLGHCLADILWRWEAGELPMIPAVIISNHKTLEKLSTKSNIPFEHIPISKENKNKDFQKIIKALEDYKVQSVVLARYMQILPSNICELYPNNIINIHHSFLPSFAGADPYGQALSRGVKLIGATCHYATADLDQGPIIEQEVRRVRHDHNKFDLLRLGQDCERLALAKGLLLHLESRIFVHNGKTIILGD